MANTNESLSERLLEFKQTVDLPENLRVVYVDTHYEGELLKETFDIDRVPIIKLVKGEKVYHLKMPHDRLWSIAELTESIRNPESLPYSYKRERVTEGIPIMYEYIISYAATNYFTSAM